MKPFISPDQIQRVGLSDHYITWLLSCPTERILCLVGTPAEAEEWNQKFRQRGGGYPAFHCVSGQLSGHRATRVLTDGLDPKNAEQAKQYDDAIATFKLNLMPKEGV